MNATIFNTCKEWVESTCWFLLQDNVKAATLIPQKAVLQITSLLLSNADPSTIRDCRACLGAEEKILTDVADKGISFLSPICPAQWKCASTSGNLKDCRGKRLQQPSMAPGAGHTTKHCAFRSAFFSLHFRTNKQCPLLSCTNTTARPSLGIRLQKGGWWPAVRA